MIATPQMEPVSKLVKDHKSVFAKLTAGPVWLAARSRPTAVLVAVDEWDRIARRMAELEGLLQAKRALERFDAGLASTTSHDELKRLLQEAGYVGD